MTKYRKHKAILVVMGLGYLALPAASSASASDSAVNHGNSNSLSDEFIDADDKLKLYFAYAEYKMGNYAVARAMWLNTVDSGKAEALFNLGNLYDIGQGVTRDVKRATEFYRQSARLGSRNSAFQLGLMHQRHPELVPISEATESLLSAAQDGDEDARTLLLTIIDEQPPSELQRVQLDIAKGAYASALKNLRVLIDQDEPDAKAFTQLGWMHERGLGVTMDMALAGEYFMRGAKLGDPEAMYSVAVMHKTGIGLAQDNEASQKWLKKAATLGFQQAQQQLDHKQ